MRRDAAKFCKYAFVKIKVVLAYARKLLQIHVFCGIIAL